MKRKYYKESITSSKKIGTLMFQIWHFPRILQNTLSRPSFKVAAADMRCFARSNFYRSLVHKKNFTLIWQVVFKLGYIFCQERQDISLSLNELGEKSQSFLPQSSLVICKQAIIKLSLAYSFRKIFFINSI